MGTFEDQRGVRSTSFDDGGCNGGVSHGLRMARALDYDAFLSTGNKQEIASVKEDEAPGWA